VTKGVGREEEIRLPPSGFWLPVFGFWQKLGVILNGAVFQAK
jgi:hypothetical protein